MMKAAIASLLLASTGAGWSAGCSPATSGPPEPAVSEALEGLEDVVRESIEQLLEQIRQAPEDAELRMELGMLYQVSGLADAVESAYQHALELAPSNPKCWYMLTLHRSEQADLEGALEACRNTIRFDPTYVAARRKLGDLLLDLGRPEEALEAYRKAVEDEPDQAANRVGLARVHLRMQAWSKAAKLLEDVLATQNGYGYASMLLGRAYIGMGEKEKARVASSRGAGTVPPLIDDWEHELQTRRVGYAGTMAEAVQLFRERDNEGVIRLLSELRERHPDEVMLLNNLASAYSRTNQVDKMLETLQHAVQVHPNHFSTHLNLSYAYAAKKDLDRALEHANRAVELRPTQGEARSQLCNLYAEKGDFARAREAIEAAIDLQGDKQALRMRLGKLLNEMGEYEDAVESFREYTGLFPSSIKGYQWLARSLVAAGRPAEASDALAEARKLNANHRANAEIDQLIRARAGATADEISSTGAGD